MPISDYASAFFFAHRTRVTFEEAANAIAWRFFRRYILQRAGERFILRKSPGFRDRNPPKSAEEVPAAGKIPR
jgi:hypothetical protein